MTMKLETPMLAILLGSMVFTGLFTVFITDLGQTHGADMNLSVFDTENNEVSFKDSFDKINQTKAEMDEINQNFEEETLTDSGSLFSFLKLTWVIGKQMLGSVNVLKDLLYGISSLLGLPPIFITGLITITSILIIISIVMILAGRSY